MKEIGEYLKDARIENGVSIDEAAEDLNLSTFQIENIEEGNIRAFKDMFTLKELVKSYSKYLGVELDPVMEEFNDFMFEHTSKISLDDIIEARKMIHDGSESEKDKVISPYTKIPKRKRLSLKMVIIGLGCIIGLLLLIYVILLLSSNTDKKITNELKSKGEIDLYEYSY